MMKRMQWLDDKLGRRKGTEEVNDEDLAAAWEKAGYVKILGNAAPTGSTKAIEAPPENKSMKGKGKKK